MQCSMETSKFGNKVTIGYKASSVISSQIGVMSKTIDTRLQISQPSKAFGKFCRSYSWPLSKCVQISFQEYVSEGISYPNGGSLSQQDDTQSQQLM